MLLPATPPAHYVHVTVRNKPIASAAIVSNGHVFLPLRETFESLYSTVVYDRNSHMVIARNILHVSVMHVDSQVALLDGRANILDSAPYFSNGTVYVPLRFAAEAMGAIVRYDSRTQTVAVNGTDTGTQSNVGIARPPQQLTPPPNSTVLTAYPVISASVSGTTASGAVRLTIDGSDVTPNAAFDGRTITYVPKTGLTPGRHTAGFFGRGSSGQAFSTQWSFVTNAPAMDTAATYGYSPYQFYATPGQAYAGGTWMNLTLVGPPNGSGFVQFCSPTIIYPLWNGGGPFYRARIAVPGFYISSGCPINAVFIDGSGRQLVITPQSNGVYLTGDPLHPIGQYPAAPTIVPVLPPFNH